MNQEINNIIGVISGISPALAGGLIRYLHGTSKRGENISIKVLISQLLIAAVVGWWVMGFISSIDYFTGKTSLQGSIIGISSFLAPNILDLVLELFPAIAKKYLKRKEIL